MGIQRPRPVCAQLLIRILDSTKSTLQLEGGLPSDRSYAMYRPFLSVLDIEVPLADLPAQAEEWEQAVTEMTSEDDEIAEYVQSLEERGDAEVDMNEAMGKIDGDALAAEFERYLRRRGR